MTQKNKRGENETLRAFFQVCGDLLFSPNDDFQRLNAGNQAKFDFAVAQAGKIDTLAL